MRNSTCVLTLAGCYVVVYPGEDVLLQQRVRSEVKNQGPGRGSRIGRGPEVAAVINAEVGAPQASCSSNIE